MKIALNKSVNKNRIRRQGKEGRRRKGEGFMEKVAVLGGGGTGGYGAKRNECGAL